MTYQLSDSHCSTNCRPHRKSDLSPERQHLVQRMQELDYGRILGLVARRHEPQWSPPPRAFRDVVIGKRSGARREPATANFVLKEQVAELCEYFDVAPDGTEFDIVVQDGLPFKVSFEDPARG